MLSCTSDKKTVLYSLVNSLWHASAVGRFSAFPSQHNCIRFCHWSGGILLPSIWDGLAPSSTLSQNVFRSPLTSRKALRPYHISHIMMPKLYMSALLSYILDLINSGATKAGVPVMVPVIIFSSFATPTSAILTSSWSDICKRIQIITKKYMLSLLCRGITQVKRNFHAC